LPDTGRRISGPSALTAARFQNAKDGHGQRHGGRLGAFSNEVQDAMATKRFLVVLDSYGGGFGGAERVDAEQIGQGAVVDRDGLGDLQEPDQLQPVESLGAGLVGVDLGQPSINGRIARDQPVDVGEAEVSADGVHGGVHRGRHQAGVSEMADVELDVGSLDTDERVQTVGLAPAEPPSKLVGV
jgi:hypothetical protein